MNGKALTRAQKVVLAAAFVPMVGTGIAGGYGTYTNISIAYGRGTAVGAVAAGEGATAVLALVLLGLTMLGQSSPLVIRAGLWALPAAASAMSATAAKSPGEMVIYALTPMGMTASAEGAAFLARRIVVHRDGRDAEAERQAAAVVQALAYHRARAAHHPSDRVKTWSERKSWRLARKVGTGDLALGDRLLDVQRDRVTAGADTALAAMFGGSITPALPAGSIGGPVDTVMELEVDRSGRPTHATNVKESDQTGMERSTPELPVPALEPVPVDPDPVGQEEPTPADPVPMEAVPVPVAVAAESPRPRRATGRVPDIARSTRPKRTSDQLLNQARSLTVNWSDSDLTAEAIRKAVRTSAEKARGLRDTLRAERAAGGDGVGEVA